MDYAHALSLPPHSLSSPFQPWKAEAMCASLGCTLYQISHVPEFKCVLFMQYTHTLLWELSGMCPIYILGKFSNLILPHEA